MSLVLRSTLIEEDGSGNATVELVISDAAATTAVHDLNISKQGREQSGSRGEIVSLRVSVRADHNFLSGYQADAIKRAIAILESARDSLRKE